MTSGTVYLLPSTGLNQQHLRFENVAFRLVPQFVGVLVSYPVDRIFVTVLSVFQRRRFRSSATTIALSVFCL